VAGATGQSVSVDGESGVSRLSFPVSFEKEALESSRVSDCALEEAFSTSLQDIYRYIRNAQAVRRNILDGVALVWKMKEAILNYQVSSLPPRPLTPPPPPLDQYSLELRRYAPLLNQKLSFPKGWMIRIHLDSLCFGFATIISKSQINSSLEETTQVDRAALTLQSVGPLCHISAARRCQSLVPIFADTLGD
jgi:hypothetical protein